jgi:hypothetical protein
MKTRILPLGDVNFSNSRPYRKNPQAALKEDCAHRWSKIPTADSLRERS